MLHASALFVVALLTMALLVRARRWRCSIWGEILDRAVILFLALVGLLALGSRLSPAMRGSALSLPLLIVAMCAPLALASRRRIFRAVLYYWGIGLCARAALFPLNHVSVLNLEFWLYGFTGAGIFAAAAYDLVINRYRPTWRDCASASIATCVCVGSVQPIDLQQILQLSVLNVGVFLVMTIPWVLLRRRPSPRVARVIPALEEDSELVYST